MKRGLVITLVLLSVIIISLSFVSAGFFSNFWGKVTGRAIENEWTQWFDRDNPSGSGDFETIVNLKQEYPGEICDSPVQIECQTLGGLDYTETGQTVTCSADDGLRCVNTNNVGGCLDYRVRFFCGSEEPADEVTADEETHMDCIDSDNGKDIYNKGTCTDAEGSKTDSCALDTLIRERFCENNVCVTETTDCPSGYVCNAGACIVEGDQICTGTATTCSGLYDNNVLIYESR